MSKMVCQCGHVIRDQSDRLPYKASLLRDLDLEPFVNGIAKEFFDLIRAERSGNVDEWVRRHFKGTYPGTLEDLMGDVVFSAYIAAATDAFECEKCGALWVQRNVPDKAFTCYTPKSGNVEHVFQ